MAYLTEKFGPVGGFHPFAGAGEAVAAARVPTIKPRSTTAAVRRRRGAGIGTFIYGLPRLACSFSPGKSRHGSAG
jgi:NitT/TauT family transport system permease protein